MRLVFDYETNGLLDRPDLRILCGAAVDLDTGEEYEANGEADLDAFAHLLARADLLVGHNICGFDIPLVQRFYPWFKVPHIYDTRLALRMRYVGDVRERFYAWRNSAGRSEEKREARFPARLMAPGKQFGLEAWGYVIGEHKGSFLADTGVQEEYTDELGEYCLRDVRVNARLYEWLQRPDRTLRGNRQEDPTHERPPTPEAAVLCESAFALHMRNQEARGVRFDRGSAELLYAKLAARREELGQELRTEHFPAWWAPTNPKGDVDPELPVRRGDASYTVPKRTYRVPHPHPLAGREKGCAFTPIELVEFNPNSGHHIAGRLRKLFGWEPKEHTPTGLPKVDETVLADLPYPPAEALREYMMLTKRLGQLAEGEQAWLKQATADGLIHGRVETVGTRTTRCAHRRPNLAQVPAVGAPFGAECRRLFRPVVPSHVLVGIDAKGLELRMLAHRLGYYDGGAYAERLLDGDPHSDWQEVTGIILRNNQKRLTYGFLYGAGDLKLGHILLDDMRQAADQGKYKGKLPKAAEGVLRSMGRRVRASLQQRVPGLGQFVAACS
ncbi:MAG: hypothetical protein GWN02_31820, partial [Gemmatimonadetes bacterium]|nr:hypothetical protein [Gemmatimonadota bacterium]NIY12576.1 hypothetical protein [Gemmatimonadota bacterium]